MAWTQISDAPKGLDRAILVRDRAGRVAAVSWWQPSSRVRYWMHWVGGKKLGWEPEEWAEIPEGWKGERTGK